MVNDDSQEGIGGGFDNQHFGYDFADAKKVAFPSRYLRRLHR